MTKNNNKQTLLAGENKSANPLGYMPVGKLLLTFSIPSIVQMLINSIYNIVDQIFIGQGVGYLGNAATTVTFPIMTIILAFAAMIGIGGAAYASIKLGQKKEEEAEKTLSSQYVLAILVGLTIMILGLLFLKPLLNVFGATDAVMPYALDYASIILLGAPFSVLGITLSNLARADGSPRMSMYSVLIGAALNCILDPIYIFVFHWGVKGAAFATITSQFITFAILTVYFLKHGKHMKLKAKYLKPNFSLWRSTTALGLSSAITHGSATVTQTVMNNSLVYYGNLDPLVGSDVALSAMGIVMKIIMILVAIGVGVGLGSQPIIGFNFGAKQPHRIKRCYFLAVSAATSIILIGWLACQIFPEQILSLFGTSSENFTYFAVRCIRIYTFAVFLSGFQIISTHFFQATGQPLKASMLSALRQLILLVPLILIFPLYFGLNGILYAGPVADVASALIVFFFIRAEMKKTNRWIAQCEEDDLTTTQTELLKDPLDNAK